MNHLPTPVRMVGIVGIVGIVGRATIYRTLISMAGQRTFWPTIILALLLVIVPLSIGLTALMPHSAASDASAQHFTTVTAESAETEPILQNQTSVDHDATENGEDTRIRGTANANALAVRQQESSRFFKDVASSDILILVSVQAPGEDDGDFWTRYKSLPPKLQGALIAVSTSTASQFPRLYVFIPQRFPDVASAIFFCSSVPGLEACNLRQIQWP